MINGCTEAMFIKPFSIKQVLFVGFSVLLIMGLAFVSASSVAAEHKEGEAEAEATMVHCLLPSMVRKYGGEATRLAPRRVVRITAAQCEQQGGEVVVVESAE